MGGHSGLMGLGEWNRFVESVPWVVGEGSAVVVGDSAGATGAGSLDAGEFPSLHLLLGRAIATPVVVDDRPVELLTWPAADDGDELSWLCRPPSQAPPPDLLPAHQRLLGSFGGIIERSSNEPSTWLLNCDDALTEDASRQDATFLQDYDWLMEDHGGAWPIDLASHYSICSEANGNTSLCDRRDGTVLLFAPDHDFDHIEPLEGCPPYSLYRIPSAPDFTTWVEVIARQWLDAIARWP